MKFTPYPFQDAGINHAVNFLSQAKPGERQLYAAPTGCGKSVVELLVQERLPDGHWIVSPKEEIIYGMLDKKGFPGAEMLDHNICTPVRLRNRLLAGEIPHPKYLTFDEGHHHNAETWQQIDLLTGFAPSIAYTATPYRGSPKSTREFIEHWGEPLWLITYEEAVAEGYIRMPNFEVLPLVDDDIVDVKGGEFDVTSLDGVTVDRLGDLAEHSRQWYNGKWDRPTIYACPSTLCCQRLQAELTKRGLPCAIVSAATKDRQTIFEATTACVLALLHINIVTEGVDLPLRRLVDLAPTMSPVKWVQQLGRITRPTNEAPPEYICTNRNIMRHAYVLEGVIPTSSIVKAERAFPQTERAHTRVLGLEAIGRFKPSVTKLCSGVSIYVYALSVNVGPATVDYCAIVHPAMDPIWASKVNVVVEGKKQWGTWAKCDPPNDMRGFASLGPKTLSEKQVAWWLKSAMRYGLDPDQEVTKKSFQALPVLSDLGVCLR